MSLQPNRLNVGAVCAAQVDQECPIQVFVVNESGMDPGTALFLEWFDKAWQFTLSILYNGHREISLVMAGR